ncbi:hypothetical protein D3C73_1194820 [compost metagenome]
MQRQNRVHVVANHRAELLQFGQRQCLKRLALLDGFYHRFTDDMVRLTERHAFGDQIVRQFGRVGVTLLRRFFTARTFHLDAIQHQRSHLQAIHPGIKRVEQPFLVFLHVFVICQRQAFQRHHHTGQCTLHAATFATDQLQCIRVFLLRHQR